MDDQESPTNAVSEGGTRCAGEVNQSVGGRPDICVEISRCEKSDWTVMACIRASSPIGDGSGIGRNP